MSESQTTLAVICKALSESIAAGAFSAEGRLPSERTLSEQFSTTRITLREALSQLEAQGLIYREVRRGWFVSRHALSTTRCKEVTFTQWRKIRGAAQRPQ